MDELDAMTSRRRAQYRQAWARCFGLLVCGGTCLFDPHAARAVDPPSGMTASRAAATQQASTTGLQEPAPVGAAPDESATTKPADDLLDLPLTQLAAQPVVVPALQQVVSTVSRQESTVGKSPAAVFVITPEMIRRSGATTIAETLRMVPGLNVARIDNANWAISSRGFNDRFANKLLVQIDGRTVYNPLFSGVFWQAQDLLLQDVERIEVIRGPGATVWGSNAVNGIINIITKSSKDTQGSMVIAGGGTEERGFSGARYGGKHEDDLTYRVWGKWREVDSGFNSAGEAVEDWRASRGGFRMDFTPNDSDLFTFQGDIFSNVEGLLDKPATPFGPPFQINRIEDRRFSGGDVLGRWSHEIDEESNWKLQVYYNNFRLDQIRLDRTEHNTLDVDFQHEFALDDSQRIIWGLGYRFDRVFLGTGPDASGFEVTSFPNQRDLNQYSAFVQDQFTLVEDLWYFTAGSKFEDNPFVGFVYQPSGRLLWTPTPRQAAWAAVSRAVRTPNFGERHSQATLAPTPPSSIFPRVSPSPGLDSEVLLAYELGYRAQPTDEFSWDMALFYNDYDHLRVLVPQFPVLVNPGPPAYSYLPLQFQNQLKGATYGLELSGNLKLTDCWRLYGQYSFLRMQLNADPTLPASTRASAEAVDRQSPRNQVYLWSSWDLSEHWQFDLMGRYVDHLSGFALGAADVPVGSYIEMDVRLGWKPRQNLELAVVGQNLLDDQHLEFGTNSLVGRPAVEVQRGVYGMLTMSW